nr:protein HEAT-STRESS-ASSOCIATED 32 [Ipomoea batatas]
MAAYRWKSFFDDEDRPEKPRSYGVTEMRSPHYSLFSRPLLQDIFESMGQFVDGLKFSGGSHSMMPKTYIREVIDMAHKHNVYVTSGDCAENLLRKGPSHLKEYIEISLGHLESGCSCIRCESVWWVVRWTCCCGGGVSEVVGGNGLRYVEGIGGLAVYGMEVLGCESREAERFKTDLVVALKADGKIVWSENSWIRGFLLSLTIQELL